MKPPAIACPAALQPKHDALPACGPYAAARGLRLALLRFLHDDDSAPGGAADERAPTAQFGHRRSTSA